MKCTNCGQSLKPSKVDNYHYTECGLNNIYLKNIVELKCKHCDDFEVVIPNLEILHNLIAHDVASQSLKLKPDEIRFLRVHLGMSGVQFASVLSVEPATISRWENGKGEMKLTNERFLRLLILAKAGPLREYDDLCNYGTSVKKSRNIFKFSIKNDHWEKSAA